LSVTNGTVCSRISRKDDNIARFNEIFESLLPGIPVPFNFPPAITGIFQLNGSHLENSTISDFPVTFQGRFFTICPRFESSEALG